MGPVVFITREAPAAKPPHNPGRFYKIVAFVIATCLKNLSSEISILGVLELIYYKKNSSISDIILMISCRAWALLRSQITCHHTFWALFIYFLR